MTTISTENLRNFNNFLANKDIQIKYILNIRANIKSQSNIYNKI